MKLVLGDESRGGAEFLAPRVGVERLIIAPADLAGSAGGPVESRIEHVAITLALPSQPSVGLPAAGSPLSDYQPDVGGAVLVHFFVKGDCFSFAIGRGTRLGLSGGFPHRRETVGDGSEVVHPLIYQRQRDAIRGSAARSREDRPDTGHLAIIRSSADGKKERIGEGGRSGEGEESGRKEKSFFHGVGVYSGYADYNYHSNGRATLLVTNRKSQILCDRDGFWTRNRPLPQGIHLVEADLVLLTRGIEGHSRQSSPPAIVALS